MRVNKFYDHQYDKLIWSGLVGGLVGIAHKIMEYRYKDGMHFDKVLEVGAGQGQHLPFIKSTFSTYYCTDLVSPNITQNSQLNLIIASEDAQSLSFKDEEFDRVIATCLLPHLDLPESALKEWRRVLKPKGILTVYIATDPGLMLRFFRTLLVVPKAIRAGFGNHLETSHIEHRNSYLLCKTLIKRHFVLDSVKLRRYPLPFLSWNFNMFAIVHIQKSENK
jgi:phosphatidylethanolamine/phosphatidyl-N-methylethanolamine N-methyltransferase